ncbi:hypothetical protein BO94DRAFT_530579 [Aspergillus sclerotioniger CBS 115572]|uniref:Histone H4 n=1 Tax=Aspergillus sclerotioniger CBS 115572 TaxID=1450535 RepID=A0A317XBB3_9EURO|nr:hypothetical protein BO94DRAFT_530579 [Aspergillus sclerotioniger CBS 115572]PWY95846.1 hypothetical protein BO94DRAFT_530579 [Aspergillus sclerotioniger CBS 115572]
MDPKRVTDKRSRRFLPKKRYRYKSPVVDSPASTTNLSPHHSKVLRNNIDGITRPTIRRLARRGGVVRISAAIYAEVRVVLKNRLTEILRHVVHVMDSSTTPRRERKVVTTRDVVFALNRMGHTLYGFDHT